MPLLITFFIALFLALVLYHALNRVPPLPGSPGDWGSSAAADPRIAVAAMMCAVAAEDGPLTAEEERHILMLLSTKVGLEPEVAKLCLTGGRRLARSLRGDLTHRLHQLLRPIQIKCNPEEKQDVVEMLNTIAGRSSERLGAVRDGIGRVASSLLN